MPRPGYSSFTVPDWLLICLKKCGPPGQSPQSIVRSMVENKIGKRPMKNELKKWRQRRE